MKGALLIGKQFGRLAVVSRAANIGRSAAWLCKCDCGNQKTVCTGSLTSGRTTSCGCYRRERQSVGGHKNATHGKSRTPEYRAWARMIHRCYFQSDIRFASYGGRGIVVCDRWQNSFDAFLADLGERPSPQHSIDRIDNDGNYEPGNVRWATDTEQCRNTRQVVHVEWDGRRLNVYEWEQLVGIPAREILKRVWRGWSAERALTQPLRRRAV